MNASNRHFQESISAGIKKGTIDPNNVEGYLKEGSGFFKNGKKLRVEAADKALEEYESDFERLTKEGNDLKTSQQTACDNYQKAKSTGPTNEQPVKENSGANSQGENSASSGASSSGSGQTASSGASSSSSGQTAATSAASPDKASEMLKKYNLTEEDCEKFSKDQGTSSHFFNTNRADKKMLHSLLDIIVKPTKAQEVGRCGSASGCASCPSVEQDLESYFNANFDSSGVCPGGISLLSNINFKPTGLDDLLLRQEGLYALLKLPLVVKRVKNQISKIHHLKKIESFEDGFRSAVSTKIEQWARHNLIKSKPVDSQMIFYEWYTYNTGKLSSPSIDDYEESNLLNMRDKNEFLLSVNFNLNPLISVANANIVQSDEIGTISTNRERENLGDGRLEQREFEGGVHGLGTKELMRYLGVGKTLSSVAVGLSNSTGSQVDRWTAKPLDRALMLESCSALSSANHAIVSKNLEVTKRNRERLADLLARFENQSGTSVQDSAPINRSSKGNKNLNVQNVNGEQGRASKDHKITSATKEGIIDKKELSSLIRGKFGLLCAGGEDSAGNCLNPNLAGQVLDAGLNKNNQAQALLNPLDLISDISLNLSVGNYEKGVALSRQLNSKRNQSIIDGALNLARREINESLDLDGEEIIDFEKGKRTFLGELNLNVLYQISRVPGGIESLKTKKPNSETAAASRIAKTNQAEYRKSKTKQRSSSVAFPSEKELKSKSLTGKARKLSSEDVYESVEVEFADIIKDSTIPLFEAISNRYIRSARPVLIKRQKKLDKGR